MRQSNRKLALQKKEPKPDEVTGPPDKIIWREGVGQVRQWFNAAGNVMKEEEAKFSFDPQRPAKLSDARRKKYEQWQWLFPPTDIKWSVPKREPYSTQPATEERKLPEWVFVALAELQGMYFPKLWARYRTRKSFADDPKQIGYYCGYILAQSAYALENPQQMEKRHRLVLQAAANQRSQVGEMMSPAINCTSLEYLRKFADAFAEAIRHDPFYIASGRPRQGRRLNRFEALRFLTDNWQDVEDHFFKKRRTRRVLHGWLQCELRKLGKPYTAGLDATEKLCESIGLVLRPHRN